MHKKIFTWFDNLPTSTELQRFHYYQGKNSKYGYSFFTFSQDDNNNKTLITKNSFYILRTGFTKPSFHRLSLRKSPTKNHATLFGSGWIVNRINTQLGFTKPNKSPTWRLVQSPTSTAILQKQSFIPSTHPPVLKLEDQLKLRTTSTFQ